MRIFKKRGGRPQRGEDTPHNAEKMNKLLKRKEKRE
jgi:hypothetical protein